MCADQLCFSGTQSYRVSLVQVHEKYYDAPGLCIDMLLVFGNTMRHTYSFALALDTSFALPDGLL